MKDSFIARSFPTLSVIFTITIALSTRILAQDLSLDLVSYWPMEVVQGGRTPDLVSGYDLDLRNLTSADLTNGIRGTCFNFVNARQTLLSRVHGTNDSLPINKHPAYTVSMWTKVNGTGQSDLRLFSEGSTTNNNPLFNLGTHSTGANGQLDVFIRQDAPLPGVGGVNHIRTTAEPFDGQWHHVVFVQQTDGTRTVYIDGALDPIAMTAKVAGQFLVNDTSIGGILRASPGSWVTGLIDEVALWKRALTEAEINNVKTNGVPKVFKRQLPLEIKKFLPDFAAVAQGDKVTLRWEANADANLSISPGIGDVAAQTQFGVGSIDVTVNASTTFTFTATRGSETLTAQATVGVVPNVAANWRLLENFESLKTGGLANQFNWVNPEGEFTVVDLSTNKVLGYIGGNDLAALPLNSLTLREGQKATLFFRLNVAFEDPANGIVFTIGLTERGIRFNGDFNANVGPYVRVERVVGVETIDVAARNGVNAPYDYMVDAFTTNQAYKVWLDIENRPFNVQDGVQNGGDLYSIYIQKEGDATRTNLFRDYVADRDAVNVDPFFGAPGTNLTHLFISTIGANQGTNVVQFDDFYLSSNGYNSTTPVGATSIPEQIVVTAFGFGQAANSFTLTWAAKAGRTYSVQKRATLGTGAWTTVVTGHPAGGATGSAVSYTDSGASGSATFYRISSP